MAVPSILPWAWTGSLGTPLISGSPSPSQSTARTPKDPQAEQLAQFRIADNEIFEALPEFDWAVLSRVRLPPSLQPLPFPRESLQWRLARSGPWMPGEPTPPPLRIPRAGVTQRLRVWTLPLNPRPQGFAPPEWMQAQARVQAEVPFTFSYSALMR